MYKYFYTIEIDMSHNVMQREFGSFVKSMFDNIGEIEFTSKTFLNEKECVDSILFEIDKICNSLTDKHHIEKLAVETYANPHLIYGETSKEVKELSIEEKTFWKDNKLALFAIFENKEEPNFMIRYVIYCFEDIFLQPEQSNYNLINAESPSKFLN